MLPLHVYLGASHLPVPIETTCRPSSQGRVRLLHAGRSNSPSESATLFPSMLGKLFQNKDRIHRHPCPGPFSPSDPGPQPVTGSIDTPSRRSDAFQNPSKPSRSAACINMHEIRLPRKLGATGSDGLIPTSERSHHAPLPLQLFRIAAPYTPITQAKPGEARRPGSNTSKASRTRKAPEGQGQFPCRGFRTPLHDRPGPAWR